MNAPLYMSKRRASQLLGVSVQTINLAIEAGTLTLHVPPGRIRGLLKLDQVEKFCQPISFREHNRRFRRG